MPLAIPVAKVGLFCTEVVMRMGTEMLAPTRAKKARFCSSLSILLRSATVGSRPFRDHTLMLALLNFASTRTSQVYNKLAVIHKSSKSGVFSLQPSQWAYWGCGTRYHLPATGKLEPCTSLAPIAMAVESARSHCRGIVTARRSRRAEERIPSSDRIDNSSCLADYETGENCRACHLDVSWPIA